MRKKQNYYQVHKNKKPKRVVRRKEDVLKIAMRVINNAIVKAQMMVENFRSMNSSLKRLQEATGVITDENKTEYFISNHGKKYRIAPPITTEQAIENFHNNCKIFADSFPNIEDLLKQKAPN